MFRSISTRAVKWNSVALRKTHTRAGNGLSSQKAMPQRTAPYSRGFFTDSLPSLLVPPAVFTGLLISLWTYKCLMTILFQDKIIYMSYMPPGARSEKLESYTADCKPVEWEQKYIKSLDGTKLAVCIGRIGRLPCEQSHPPHRHVVICYFQGNGSSTPPRLPLLSNVLKSIERHAPAREDIRFSVVALSYRGYWKSHGRSSQKGIERDTQALLRWVNSTYGGPGVELQLLLWGQSIGAGIASTGAAEYLDSQAVENQSKPAIVGIVLETPFSSIKSMLIALYPQRWLPYRYLSIFLWNFWDSESALRRIAESGSDVKVLLMSATRDEVVPRVEADKLETICRELRIDMKRKDIIGALHTEATTRREGQDAVAWFAIRVGSI